MISSSSIRCCIISTTLPAPCARRRGRFALPAACSIVDFAPHEEESLRTQHAHRRLGFSGEEIAGLMDEAGLDVIGRRDLVPSKKDGGKLTVSLWLGRDRRIIADPIPLTNREFA